MPIIVVDLQASDVQSLEAKGKLKVISTPQYNAVTFISMNNQIPPFDNVNVRRAVAFALPYDDMFKAALFGRGSPLFGATWADGKPTERRLSDPAAGQARPREGQGISEGGGHAGRLLDHVQLQCRPGLDRRTDGGAGQGIARPRSASRSISRSCRTRRCRRRSTRRSCRSSPRASSPGCPRPTISTATSTPAISAGTTPSINNPELAAIAQKARFEPDKAKYEEDGLKLNAIHFSEMPQIPLWQPSQDAVMAHIARRLHLPVPPPGRLSRSQPQVTGRCDGGFGATVMRAGGVSCPRCRRSLACWSSPSF